MTWTEERIRELTRLWEAGHSASHIGGLLGVTKNAVIGKAHRLKLPSRPSPIGSERPVARPHRVAAPRPKPKPTPQLAVLPRPVPPPAPRVVRIRTGGPSCLWPIGDPGQPDFHFCGDPAVSGKPYCEAHCARAYVTRTRSNTEAA